MRFDKIFISFNEVLDNSWFSQNDYIADKVDEVAV